MLPAPTAWCADCGLPGPAARLPEHGTAIPAAWAAMPPVPRSDIPACSGPAPRQRFAAYVLDTVPLALGAGMVGLPRSWPGGPFGLAESQGTGLWAALGAAILAGGLTVLVLGEATCGSTPGQRLLGLRVHRHRADASASAVRTALTMGGEPRARPFGRAEGTRIGIGALRALLRRCVLLLPPVVFIVALAALGAGQGRPALHDRILGVRFVRELSPSRRTPWYRPRAGRS